MTFILDEDKLSAPIVVDTCTLIGAIEQDGDETCRIAKSVIDYAINEERLLIPAPVFAEIMNGRAGGDTRVYIEKVLETQNIEVLPFGLREALVFGQDSFFNAKKTIKKDKHSIKFDKMIVACTLSVEGCLFVTMDNPLRVFAVGVGVNAPRLVDLTKPQQVLPLRVRQPTAGT